MRRSRRGPVNGRLVRSRMVSRSEAEEKEQNEAARFQAAKLTLAKALTVIFREGRAVKSSRHPASVGGGESTTSGSQSLGLTLSHQETLAGYVIL